MMMMMNMKMVLMIMMMMVVMRTSVRHTATFVDRDGSSAGIYRPYYQQFITSQGFVHNSWKY